MVARSGTSQSRRSSPSRGGPRSPGKSGNGLSTTINRHRAPAIVSERQGPSDEETAAVIEDWLHIPNLYGQTEEELLAHSADPANCTDETFPAGGAALGEDADGFSEMNAVEWRRMKGTVYLAQPHPVKIAQGERSSTWFMGALAAVATRQDLLLDLIVSDDLSQYGLYTFQFYKHGIWHQVVVDDMIPHSARDGAPLFCSSAYDGELWPALLEKAYAKVHGNYRALSHGSMEDALVDLTGGSAFMLDLSTPQWQEEVANGQLWLKLVQYNSWGYVVPCVNEVPGAKPNSEGPGKLLLNHAYSIIDVQQTSNGLQLLRMSNPWLGGNWEGAWSINSPEWGKPENAGLAEELGYDFDDDGTFWISFWDFVASFNRVYVARLFPPSWHQLTLHSGWMDGTAGGPPAGMFDTEELSPTWCCNPQFRVTVRKPAELLLCLSQRDPQITYGGYVQEDHREMQFGCVVLQDGPDETARRWTFRPEEALTILGPTGARDVTASLKVEPSHSYLVIPFTSVPGQSGAFVMRTFSSAPLEVEQLPSPLQLQMSDRWKGASAGGSRSLDTWGSNPQYLLTCPQRTKILLSIIRTDEHVDEARGDEEEFIGFTLTRPREAEDGLDRCLAIRSENEVVYEAPCNSARACTALVPVDPDMPYVLTPSTSGADVQADFMVSIIGSSPVELVQFPPVRSITLAHKWEEETAGGCDLNPMWKKNPKFLLKTTMPAQFRVNVTRVGGRKWKKGMGIDGMIGFYVLKSDNPNGEISDYKHAVLAEAPFMPMDTAEQVYSLDAGMAYVIMPTTYGPGKVGRFTISATSTSNFQFLSLDEVTPQEA
eukprot:jgi/Tetstr1/456401/TSEL_043135.t1